MLGCGGTDLVDMRPAPPDHSVQPGQAELPLASLSIHGNDVLDRPRRTKENLLSNEYAKDCISIRLG